MLENKIYRMVIVFFVLCSCSCSFSEHSIFQEKMIINDPDGKKVKELNKQFFIYLREISNPNSKNIVLIEKFGFYLFLNASVKENETYWNNVLLWSSTLKNTPEKKAIEKIAKKKKQENLFYKNKIPSAKINIRRDYEEKLLNYVEFTLLYGDDHLGYFEQIRDCYKVLKLKKIYFKYRSDILFVRLKIKEIRIGKKKSVNLMSLLSNLSLPNSDDEKRAFAYLLVDLENYLSVVHSHASSEINNFILRNKGVLSLISNKKQVFSSSTNSVLMIEKYLLPPFLQKEKKE